MGMIKWISQSVWIAGLMFFAMLAFFIVLGGIDLGQSAALTVLLGCLAAVGAGYSWLAHRARTVDSLSPEQQRWRERRGF